MRVRRLPSVLGAAAALALGGGLAASEATAAITQPPQPTSGPGGSDYSHADWRVSSGGTGANGWYVFEPAGPRSASAPLAVVMHGYYEFTGYVSEYEFIRHTVRKGNVVIYPRWQTGVTTPCPGPFNIEPCMRSAVNGIRGGLAYLRASESRVQPQLDKASYFGLSFGGIITANLANRYLTLGLPKPRAIFLDDIHDGGLAGTGEPALDDSMSGIPSDVKLQCHSGAEGVIARPDKATSSCNALFPKLGHIPAENKDLVLTQTDRRGDPGLSSGHGVCLGFRGRADAYDWNFCWKVWDALRSAAYDGTDCQYALGDTPEHRSNGTWSDGVAVAPLKVQNAAPIGPGPDSSPPREGSGECRKPGTAGTLAVGFGRVNRALAVRRARFAVRCRARGLERRTCAVRAYVRRGARKLRVGAGKASLSGRSARVRLRLNGRGRRVLRARGSKSLRVLLEARVRDGAGRFGAGSRRFAVKSR